MARILLIDTASVIDRLRKQLIDLGHEVTAVDTDAYAALDQVRSTNAELMIIALNLPGGGAQLIGKLRTDAATARTPIIALFDDNWTGIQQDSLTRLLQKPTDTDALKCVLDELLPQVTAPPAKASPLEPDAEGEIFSPPPAQSKSTAAMDFGAPSDDDLPPGETIEL